MVGTKKFVFIIVEGKTDKLSLQKPLQSLFSPINTVICKTNGDVFSDTKTNQNNVTEILYGYLKRYLRNSNGVYASDCVRIIQVVDTDGAFIEDSRIIENKHLDYGETRYDDQKKLIRTKSKYEIRKRNEKKRDALSVLLDGTHEIHGIPYCVYYMSCNLEHVLHNKANLSSDEKTRLAKAFCLRYKDNLVGFIEFIADSPFSVTDGYQASWDYLRDNEHRERSIERHTNLGVLLGEYYKTSKPRQTTLNDPDDPQYIDSDE